MTIRQPLIYLKLFWICTFLAGCMGWLSAQNLPKDTLNRELIDSLMNEVGNLSSAQRDSLRSALLGMFTAAEFIRADQIQDSLFGHGERKFFSIPPNRKKNDLLSKPIREVPGASLYLPIPDDWKSIDPFAHQSMMPKLPQKVQAPLPDYARFTLGIDGYYFAFQEMGFFGYGWSKLDSLQALQAQGASNTSFDFEAGFWTPNRLKKLKRTNDALVILAVILQALLL